MVFKSITITDFLSYYGDNYIEFSDMTTVFIGQNNTGKSKLFDAINYALYGRIFPTDKGENGEWIYNSREIADFALNNHKKEESLRNGDDAVDVRVQLDIEKDFSLIRIDRTISYKRLDDDFVFASSLLSVSEIDKSTGREIYSGIQEDASDRLEQYFSKSIKNYFLFQGEAASKIMGLQKGGNFSKAVKDIARLSVFEDAKEIADGYTKHVNNVLARKMNKNKDVLAQQKKYQEEIDDLEFSLKNHDNKKTEAENNINEYSEKLREYEDKLSEMKEFEEWFSKKKELDDKAKRNERELKEANSEKTEIAEDIVFYKIRDKVKSFKTFYNNLENKGEVPPSIPAAEIRKALEYCRCTICNTDLSDGTKARKYAESRLPKCDTDKLGNFLREINHTFGDVLENIVVMPKKIEAIIERKHKLEDKKRTLLKEKEELDSLLAQIQLNDSQSAEKKKQIDDIRQSIRRYNDLLDKAKHSFAHHGGAIDAINTKLQRLRGQQSLLIGSAPELDEHDRIWSNIAPKISSAMDKLYEVAYDRAYNEVQRKSDEYYQEMTKDNAGLVGNIRIDTQNSEIYTVDEQGNRIRNVNQGNRVSIQLAVIAGILTIAQEQFGQQYPFVTDAPVSALGGDNKISTIKTMISAFDQSIIIIKDDTVTKNKTNDEIRNLINESKSVGIAYELSMSEAQTKNDQHTVVKRIKG